MDDKSGSQHQEDSRVRDHRSIPFKLFRDVRRLCYYHATQVGSRGSTLIRRSLTISQRRSASCSSTLSFHRRKSVEMRQEEEDERDWGRGVRLVRAEERGREVERKEGKERWQERRALVTEREIRFHVGQTKRVVPRRVTRRSPFSASERLRVLRPSSDPLRAMKMDQHYAAIVAAS